MPWYLRKMLARGGYMDEANPDKGGDGAPPKTDTPAPNAEDLKKLADEKAELLKEVMGKKEKIQKLEKDHADLAAKLKDFDGIDPVKVRELLAAQAENERKQLEAKGDFESLKKQMVDAHEQEKKALAEQKADLEKTNGSLLGQIADLTVGSSFGSSAFIRDELILTPTKARVVYGSHFEFTDGKVVGFDKPAGTANRTMLVDARGEPLAFEAALQKIVEADPDKDTVLKAKSKPGSGSSTNNTNGKQGAETGEQRSGVSRIAAGLRAQNGKLGK